jgi:diketogulonate reductase-like aldo/keto reductase
VNRIAEAHNVSVIQVLLAWVMQQENMIAIPKAGSANHVKQNSDVFEIELSEDELALLNEAFPSPNTRVPLRIQ